MVKNIVIRIRRMEMKKSTVTRRIGMFIVALFAISTIVFNFGNTRARAASGSMRGLSAAEIVKDMGVGWNLGNSFESEGSETGWGNPYVTRELINSIANKGYKTIRIPVRWDDNYSDQSNYTISDEYMNRVETVVNYALDADLYVIINVHHNDLQTMVSTDYGTQWRVKDELKKIWTQIGNRFKGYGDKLVFEVNNEPRCGEDWNGNASYYDCVNQYNEAARASIRATGGNNKKRLVMLPTYCASSTGDKVYGWKNLSDDPMIAVSVHAYEPWDFAYEGNGHSNWSDSDYDALKQIFEKLDSVFVKKSVPVVIGEFGATDKNNYADRVKYAEVFTSFAKQYGMACVWWDNNVTGYGGEKFGIFDRNTNTFVYPDIANAMVKVLGKNAQSSDVSSSDSGMTLFWGDAWSSNWGQAVSVATTRAGGSVDASGIKKGGHFYVEYGGTKGELELILQSYSGGASWAKVKPDETGNVNGHYYSIYSYDNCVAAFGSNHFSDFLDMIHVGATSKALNVYLLCYDTSDVSSDEGVTMFWGDAWSSNWGQAVSVATTRVGGTIDASKIKKGGHFYVEYGGTKGELELILQSYSGGASWAKVKPNETGNVNGHYYAIYSYDNCVAAFGSDHFSDFLDMIHVGATSKALNVYLLCYDNGN